MAPSTTSVDQLASELGQYLPADVIKWMEDHPPVTHHEAHGEQLDLIGVKPLPDHDNLPVILAVRLSLSFPSLFCAVPLYAVDFIRRRRTSMSCWSA